MRRTIIASLAAAMVALLALRATPDARAVTPEPRRVREAQRTLRDLGYRPGPIDGIVGPQTRAAVTSYQRSERLPATGRFDPETLVRLDIYERLFRSTHQPGSEARRGEAAI